MQKPAFQPSTSSSTSGNSSRIISRGPVGARVVDHMHGHGAGLERVTAKGVQAGAHVLARARADDDDHVEQAGARRPGPARSSSRS